MRSLPLPSEGCRRILRVAVDIEAGLEVFHAYLSDHRFTTEVKGLPIACLARPAGRSCAHTRLASADAPTMPSDPRMRSRRFSTLSGRSDADVPPMCPAARGKPATHRTASWYVSRVLLEHPSRSALPHRYTLSPGDSALDGSRRFAHDRDPMCLRCALEGAGPRSQFGRGRDMISESAPAQLRPKRGPPWLIPFPVDDRPNGHDRAWEVLGGWRKGRQPSRVTALCATTNVDSKARACRRTSTTAPAVPTATTMAER